MRIRYWRIMVLCLFSANVLAGSGRYQLDWPEPSQQLYYRSCGAGDSCWVVELVSQPQSQLLLQLHCQQQQLRVTDLDTGDVRRYQFICDQYQQLNPKSVLLMALVQQFLRL